jgi:hypothetical protein
LGYSVFIVQAGKVKAVVSVLLICLSEIYFQIMLYDVEGWLFALCMCNTGITWSVLDVFDLFIFLFYFYCCMCKSETNFRCLCVACFLSGLCMWFYTVGNCMYGLSKIVSVITYSFGINCNT